MDGVDVVDRRRATWRRAVKAVTSSTRSTWSDRAPVLPRHWPPATRPSAPTSVPATPTATTPSWNAVPTVVAGLASAPVICTTVCSHVRRWVCTYVLTYVVHVLTYVVRTIQSPTCDLHYTVSQKNGPLRLITVWKVVQTVLTATFNSYSDRQISTSHKIDTPEPIDKKLDTVDYVHETTPYTKFGTNTHWGLLGKWVKYNNIIYLFIYLYLFFSDSRTGQTCWWIFTRDSSKDVKSRKDVPFWGYKII